MQIYPNPSNGIITINASNWEGQKSVEIINILGQVVLQADVKDESTLSLTHLKKGTYLVRVTNELGNIKVKKIILK
ncbi:T9SS type A sorting domain-containing protein [Flammeovirga yaeyamensis]|uniref:T9SS type A sorting domain-containing protein n=1 Tax=Flammeovirga yaeyamensis TaxID=367791 RepID=UPI0034DAEE17